MAKRFFSIILIAIITLQSLSAANIFNGDVVVKWGTTDCRYPRGNENKIPATAVNKATAWRGERVNFQLLINNKNANRSVEYSFGDLKCGKNVISSSNIIGGFVQDIITDHFTGCGKHAVDAHGENLVADKITNTNPTELTADTYNGLWFTVNVPADTKPGNYHGTVTINSDGESCKMPYTVKVLNHTLPAPKEWKFHLDLWQNPYAVARVHGVEPWSAEHFHKLRPYMMKLAGAGQKAITATLIDRPWDGQTHDPFGSMVTWMRKADGSWYYDLTIFDKWVEFMMDCGIDKEITCFSMIPWKLSFRYYDQATDSHKYMQCAPGEKTYEQFWGGMLQAFAQHLKEKGWFEKTFISMDERSLPQMQAAIAVIKKYAPGMKISMAGNYHPEIEADITDYCLDIFAYTAYTPELLARRRSEGKVSTYYTCCSAEYPNLFTFTAPADAEFIALEALAKDLDGYLRWAYNSWTVEPEKDSRYTAWPAGDTYVIYPHSISSVRWERLVQGIQQYEKYKILHANGNKQTKAKLEKLLQTVEINKIATDSEKIVNKFRNELNKF